MQVQEPITGTAPLSEKHFDGLVITSHSVRDAKSKERATTTLINWQHQSNTAVDWIRHLESGHTIQPSQFTPKPEGKYTHALEFWQHTHFVFCDADNIKGVEFLSDGTDKNPEGIAPFTSGTGLSELYPTLKEKAFAIGQSVSSMSEDKPPAHRRYRLVFLFDEPITTEEKYHAILLALADEFSIIPPAERSPAQPIFGSERDGYNKFAIIENVLSVSDYPDTPPPKAVPTAKAVSTAPTLDTDTKLNEFLDKHSISYTPCSKESEKYFVECPNKEQHTKGICKEKDAYVFTNTDSKFAFHCSHTSCKAAGRTTWQAFKDGYGIKSSVSYSKPKAESEQTPVENGFEVKEKKEPTAFEYPQLSDDVFYGGFSDLYDAFIEKGNYVLDKPFVLALGLSAVGIISARKRYIKAYAESDVVLFPNAYSLVVGTSTYASKSTTREHLVRLIDNVHIDAEINNEINLLTSVSTKQSLLAELETEVDIDYFDGVTALLHFDELKAMFDNMRRDYASDIQSLLNTLWSCPIRQQNRAISNKIDVFYPVMNIFGCSTREWLNAALIKDDLDGGFMNRFMAFYSDGLDDYISKPTIDEKSYDAFLQKLIRLLDEPTDKKGERRARGYILSDEAFSTYDNFCKKAYTEGRQKVDNIGTRRSSLHALKIALALHIITDPHEYEIGFNCIDSALKITEYLEQVGTFLYSQVVSDQSAKIEQRILSLLNRKDNSLPKRKILQSLKDAGYREVGNVIDGLIRENVLYINTENGNVEVLK